MPVYKYKIKTGNKTLYLVKIQTGSVKLYKRGFVDKKSALLYEAEFLKNPQSPKKIKCSELDAGFAKFLYQKLREASAYRYYGLFTNYIQPHFSNMTTASISNGFIQKLNNDLNKTSLKNKKALFYIGKIYLRFLKTYGLDNSINESNLYCYKEKHVERKNFDYYTIEEFNKLLEICDDARFTLILKLLYYYGLRIGELRGLAISDINYTRDILSIKRSITNKSGSSGQKVVDVKTSSSYRDYPLTDSIKKSLDDYKKEYDLKKGFLFPATRKQDSNKVIGETTLKRLLVHYCELAKLRVIKFHEFRHSCATRLINNGCPIELISSWLGHSDITTTSRIYAHIMPNKKRETLKYFD